MKSGVGRYVDVGGRCVGRCVVMCVASMGRYEIRCV